MLFKKYMIQKPKIQKQKSPYLLLIIGCCVLAIIAIFIYLVNSAKAYETAASTEYAGFGIEMPADYIVHGIDISSHQKTIAWNKVASMRVNDIDIRFAFIKATEGLNDIDKNYATNYAMAKNVGMVCGAYHFFLATKSGREQAENFIKNSKLSIGDLPPVVDVEQLYGTPVQLMQQRLTECLQVLENHYHTKPIIYTYASFYKDYLSKQFAQYPLWVAHYTETTKPTVDRDWTFWQHSEQGNINGITTRVDCNVFNGDEDDFGKLLMK